MVSHVLDGSAGSRKARGAKSPGTNQPQDRSETGCIDSFCFLFAGEERLKIMSYERSWADHTVAIGGTRIEPEFTPRRRASVYVPGIGYRIVYLAPYADTYFSVPAKFRHKGKTIKGFISIEYRSDEIGDELVFTQTG